MHAVMDAEGSSSQSLLVLASADLASGISKVRSAKTAPTVTSILERKLTLPPAAALRENPLLGKGLLSNLGPSCRTEGSCRTPWGWRLRDGQPFRAGAGPDPQRPPRAPAGSQRRGARDDAGAAPPQERTTVPRRGPGSSRAPAVPPPAARRPGRSHGGGERPDPAPAHLPERGDPEVRAADYVS